MTGVVQSPRSGDPHLGRWIGLYFHLFQSCCGRCGARLVAMLHKSSCVVQCWTISCASQWRPTLVRAHAHFLQQGARVQDICQSSPPSRDNCWMVCSMNFASLSAGSPMSPSPQTAFLMDSRVSPNMLLGVALSEITRLHLQQRTNGPATHAPLSIVSCAQNQFWSD